MELVNYIIPVCKWIGNAANGKDYSYRIENLNFVLKKFLLKQKNINLRVILIEQSLDGDFNYISDLEYPEDLQILKLEVNYPVFNKCWLYNIAANVVASNHLIFAEVDTYSSDEKFLYKLLEFAKDKEWCSGWTRLRYTNKEERDMVLREKQISNNHSTTWRGIGKGSEGGVIYFDKKFFDSIGGYNEWIEELGGTDNEIAVRANYVSKSYLSNSILFIIYGIL